MLDDYRACAYFKWFDKELEGRARIVIRELASKKVFFFFFEKVLARS